MKKISEAISDTKDTVSSALRPIKFAASATVGIPLAAAASIIMLCASAILRGMDLCWSVVSKSSKSIFQTELYYDPFLHDAAEWMWGKTKSLWTDFGLYAHLSTAQWVSESANSVSSYAGLSSSVKKKPDLSHEEMIEKYSDKKNTPSSTIRPTKHFSLFSKNAKSKTLGS